ncbi:MAG: hypothetical protein JSS82_08195 [Bacteroidetes bacterium]|nr:hypothetical protein [Bacteroidota bacterium]
MSKTTSFYRATFQRQSHIKNFILNYAYMLCSYPRLVIEMLIRKNFGCRYFNVASAITAIVVMAWLPFHLSPYRSYWEVWIDILQQHFMWYAYLSVFIYCSWLRWKEVRRNPSVYDFEKFSEYAGDIHPIFHQLEFDGRTPNARLIEIVLEPLPFFIGGILMIWMGQSLGMLLTVCSIFYSLSYWAAYTIGDNLILDKIDEIIFAEELENIFVFKQPPSKTRGAQFHAQLPTDLLLSQKLVEQSWEYSGGGEPALAI